MNTRRFPIAAALAAAFSSMLPATSASATALGEVATLSAIGEPFRAEIRVASGAAEDLAGCLRVVVPEDGTRDLPWLKNGRISSTGRGAGARIVVSSSEQVHEPALRLAIANICDAQLRRDYTLLLPYPGSAPLPITAPEPRQATDIAAPPAAREHRTTWTTTTGESLASLASALYPDDPAARRRFARATAAANPDLFPDAASQQTELPAGTTVRIPDLRRQAATRPAAARETAPPPARRQTAPTPAPTPARPASRAAAESPPPTPATGNDRVVVATGRQEAGTEAPMQAAAGLAPTPRGAMIDPTMRERQLVAAIDRSIVAEMELLARIKELEQIQAKLEEQARALAATAPATPIAIPSAAQAAAAVPATATGKGWHDWSVAGGLLFATLVVLAGLSRRRRAAASGPAPRPAPAAKTALSAPQASAEPRLAAAGSASAGATPGAVTVRTSSPAPHEPHSRIGWQSPGPHPHTEKPTIIGEEHDAMEDHKSAVELADIMMSFGRLQGAADTLAEFIQGNPRQAITPWLKLLDVYRAAGLRGEFEELSRQLNKTFNVRRVNWDNYDGLRNTPLSLENMPHIAERLARSWGSHECQAYIQQLLRDNRDGSRQGLPFVVIDELLLLEGILEQQLGPYRTYAMKVADTAQ